MTRIKEDIIREVMNQIKLDRKFAKQIVESILLIMKEALESGDEVMISGFGHFKVRHKNSRVGRNPKTKVSYEISERTVVTFYPSKVFRKELNSAKG